MPTRKPAVKVTRPVKGLRPQFEPSAGTANLMLNVYDGRRELISKTVEPLVRIIDGNQSQLLSKFCKGPTLNFELPFFDNFRDSYTVIVSADDYIQAGFTPVKVKEKTWRFLDLMLLPKAGNFNFALAQWETLRATHPSLFSLLSHGAANDASARERYEDLMENHGERLAAFFNITTAMAAINLPVRSPLDYLKEIIWDELQQDRFFAYAEAALVEQVERAAANGVFTPEVGAGFFHTGATRSYKQVQFGEANVQITFHERDTRVIDGIACVKVEPDIDYYKDVAAHTLLEVLPNTVSGRLTDPRHVYVLRWTAGRQAGVPEFNPPYVIA
jgi:hypothetical protein